MELPNHREAVVPRRKITDYLLSPTHRVGRHKAVFFRQFGFAAANWELLAAALRKHAAIHQVARAEESPFGTRYVIDGIMATPDGRTANVRSVWFIETGEDTPRFVTAHPLPRSKR